MKFLVDAQLPRRLVQRLNDAGCDAVHSLDLPQGNRTTDAHIAVMADSENRVVVTKDADFVNEHTLHHRPAKLLLISTGNMSNHVMDQLFRPRINSMIREFEANDFLELGHMGIVVRA